MQGLLAAIAAVALLLLWSRRCPGPPATMFTAGLDPVRATAHFTWSELDPSGTIRAAPNGQQRLHQLAKGIEQVRQYLDTPIRVVASGVNANGYVFATIDAPATLSDGSIALPPSQLYSTVALLQRQGRVQFGNAEIESRPTHDGVRVENGGARWSP